jgi:hypothetical protein
MLDNIVKKLQKAQKLYSQSKFESDLNEYLASDDYKKELRTFFGANDSLKELIMKVSSSLSTSLDLDDFSINNYLVQSKITYFVYNFKSILKNVQFEPDTDFNFETKKKLTLQVLTGSYLDELYPIVLEQIKNTQTICRLDNLQSTSTYSEQLSGDDDKEPVFVPSPRSHDNFIRLYSYKDMDVFVILNNDKESENIYENTIDIWKKDLLSFITDRRKEKIVIGHFSKMSDLSFCSVLSFCNQWTGKVETDHTKKRLIIDNLAYLKIIYFCKYFKDILGYCETKHWTLNLKECLYESYNLSQKLETLVLEDKIKDTVQVVNELFDDLQNKIISYLRINKVE